jgi:hypothetical protein
MLNWETTRAPHPLAMLLNERLAGQSNRSASFINCSIFLAQGPSQRPKIQQQSRSFPKSATTTFVAN